MLLREAIWRYYNGHKAKAVPGMSGHVLILILHNGLLQQQRHMSPHPRDSLGFLAIVAHPNGLHEPLAPIATSPNGLPEQHRHMSTHSRDSLDCGPIVVSPDSFPEQHRHMSTHSRDSLGFSPIVTLLSSPHEQLLWQNKTEPGWKHNPLWMWLRLW